MIGTSAERLTRDRAEHKTEGAPATIAANPTTSAGAGHASQMECDADHGGVAPAANAASRVQPSCFE